MQMLPPIPVFQSFYSLYFDCVVHMLGDSNIMALVICFLLSIGLQTLVYMPPATVVALPMSSETDKLALLALKDKLTNGMLDTLPSWNESIHLCDWQGVRCSPRHKRVSVLHLENQYWGGTLGPALGNLTFLRNLNLSNINLHGRIPREVGRLKRLQILDLSHNNLHGEIPVELTNCSNLQQIFLVQNNFTGKVPSWLGSMTQLTVLYLYTNNLVGTVPPSLGNLSTLEKLSLSYNHLEGNIPLALGRLSKLNELDLGINSLSGTISHSLYNLSNIQSFAVEENQLLGVFPSNINLVFTKLEAFLIAGNHFTGTFPSISNLSELRLFDISTNDFYGLIPPNLGSLNKLRYFGIGWNRFGSGRTHDLDFLSSLTNCTQLQTLSFEKNRLGGVLPDLIGNFSTHLHKLHLAYNQISGMIPEAIGQLSGLTSIIMMENSLEGTIPVSIGKLINLVRLVLEDNKLSGNIPTVIGNLTMLTEFYLGNNRFEGSIPFTLRSCTNMQSFSVYNNFLSGNILNQTFGYQEGLVNLYLYNNSLTGPLPSEFGNLKLLSTLYLHHNKLSGEIPKELSACLALSELALGTNSFQGSIPLFLGSLSLLQILSISNNNFTGTIPHELQNLRLLNNLDQSFNHLYGEVPTKGVFNNITAISLIGNKGLCGGIRQLNLPKCSNSPSKKHKTPLKKIVILIIVIGGVLISFIVSISIYYLRKKPKKLSSSPSLQNRYMKVSYGELHQATNGFSSSNLVGVGSFGSVYKGTLLQFERPIAVKALNLQTYGASKSFVAECKALSRIKHRNLLNILTCCSSVDHKGADFKAIVFEFMPNGSLESLLQTDEQGESRNLKLSLKQRLYIALYVAYALDYLHHDCEQPIVYCDIKPSNVLLDDDFVAHLGDFGLVRLLHGSTGYSSRDQANSSAIKGTIGYVPPEYGVGGPVSPQGDIYSYGLLLLEMLTGKKPTNSIFSEGLSLHRFCKMAIPEGITNIVDSHLLISFNGENRRAMQQQNMEDNIRECLVSFARIGVACSTEIPTQRMGIKDVIVQLHAIKQKLPH